MEFENYYCFGESRATDSSSELFGTLNGVVAFPKVERLVHGDDSGSVGAIGLKEKVTVGLLPTDLSWSVAGMERSEPSLVPEWLKGAGGGGGAAHHSQPPIHQGSYISRLLFAPPPFLKSPHL